MSCHCEAFRPSQSPEQRDYYIPTWVGTRNDTWSDVFIPCHCEAFRPSQSHLVIPSLLRDLINNEITTSRLGSGLVMTRGATYSYPVIARPLGRRNLRNNEIDYGLLNFYD